MFFFTSYQSPRSEKENLSPAPIIMRPGQSHKQLERALPVSKVKPSLNPKGHQNCITGSKVIAILLDGGTLPIGGVAPGRVFVCSLRSRLVSLLISQKEIIGRYERHIFVPAKVF